MNDAASAAGGAGPSMLLVLPVPFRDRGGELLVESQALNGLARWADNFARLTVAAPVIPDDPPRAGRTDVWVGVDGWGYRDRVELVPLPPAYRVSEFLRAYRPTRRRLAALIARSGYLQFAIGGMVGDWGAVGAWEAHAQGRKYAVHTDRVEHRASVVERGGAGLGRRVKALALAPVMRAYEASLIRRSELSLLHGADCFREYARYSKRPYLIHDVHVKPADRATEAEAEAKAASAEARPALRVCYAGRMAPMKAPLDWLRALARARDLGARFEADWLGDGPLLGEARRLAGELGLGDRVRLPGFVSDRSAVLATIRRADLMLFCHVTPESPRCLIEALVCATPLVGYRSDYAEDLLAGGGGGVLVAPHDWEALGRALHDLDADRGALAGLVRGAVRSGARFDDGTIFRHRSGLIKSFL